MRESGGYESKLRLDLWALGEESKHLFDELIAADAQRASEILDEMQILQARIADKLTALRALIR